MNAHFAHLLHSDRGYFSRAEAIDCGETVSTFITGSSRIGCALRIASRKQAFAAISNVNAFESTSW